MGIEYIDDSQSPYERAISLINLVDSDLDEIAIMLEDVRDYAIHFEEKGKNNKAHFWKEVHRFIVCHFLKLPVDKVRGRIEEKKRKNII